MPQVTRFTLRDLSSVTTFFPPDLLGQSFYYDVMVIFYAGYWHIKWNMESVHDHKVQEGASPCLLRYIITKMLLENKNIEVPSFILPPCGLCKLSIIHICQYGPKHKNETNSCGPSFSHLYGTPIILEKSKAIFSDTLLTFWLNPCSCSHLLPFVFTLNNQ